MGKPRFAEPDSNMRWNQTPVDGLLPLWKTRVIPWSLFPFQAIVRGLPRFPTPSSSVNLPQAFQHSPDTTRIVFDDLNDRGLPSVLWMTDALQGARHLTTVLHRPA